MGLKAKRIKLKRAPALLSKYMISKICKYIMYLYVCLLPCCQNDVVINSCVVTCDVYINITTPIIIIIISSNNALILIIINNNNKYYYFFILIIIYSSVFNIITILISR